jgi:hypothetical protein
MTSKIKFENIHLIDHNIVLSFKSKEEVIHFSEIDKMYVKKNKDLLFLVSVIIIGYLNFIINVFFI